MSSYGVIGALPRRYVSERWFAPGPAPKERTKHSIQRLREKTTNNSLKLRNPAPERGALVAGLRCRALLSHSSELPFEVVEVGVEMRVLTDLRHAAHLRYGRVADAPGHDAVHHFVEPGVEARGDVGEAPVE